MKRIVYLSIAAAMLTLTSCGGAKESNSDSATETAFALAENTECVELAKQTGVSWFTVDFKRIGAQDSTVLYAALDGKSCSTNVVRIGDKAWKNLANATATINDEPGALTPEIFAPSAHVLALESLTKEQIEANAKADYDAQLKEMENVAVSMLKALSKESATFADYCTLSLAMLGKKLHNDYDKNNISYQQQERLPECPYLGYYETGFDKVGLTSSNPEKGTVTVKGQGFGEGYIWDCIFTCTMANVEGKWLVDKVNYDVRNEREGF